MLIMWFFLPIKACPICCSVCSASQEMRVTQFVQPTINPLACCICWTGLLGRAVFPPWNECPNFGSYSQCLYCVKDCIYLLMVPYKVPQTVWFKQMFIFSQFRRLLVWMQGVGRVGFFWGLPPCLVDGHLLPLSLLYMVFPKCVSVS